MSIERRIVRLEERRHQAHAAPAAYLVYQGERILFLTICRNHEQISMWHRCALVGDLTTMLP